MELFTLTTLLYKKWNTRNQPILNEVILTTNYVTFRVIIIVFQVEWKIFIIKLKKRSLVTNFRYTSTLSPSLHFIFPVVYLLLTSFSPYVLIPKSLPCHHSLESWIRLCFCLMFLSFLTLSPSTSGRFRTR